MMIPRSWHESALPMRAAQLGWWMYSLFTLKVFKVDPKAEGTHRA
jgi:hypothetical protein